MTLIVRVRMSVKCRVINKLSLLSRTLWISLLLRQVVSTITTIIMDTTITDSTIITITTMGMDTFGFNWLKLKRLNHLELVRAMTRLRRKNESPCAKPREKREKLIWEPVWSLRKPVWRPRPTPQPWFNRGSCSNNNRRRWLRQQHHSITLVHPVKTVPFVVTHQFHHQLCTNRHHQLRTSQLLLRCKSSSRLLLSLHNLQHSCSWWKRKSSRQEKLKRRAKKFMQERIKRLKIKV